MLADRLDTPKSPWASQGKIAATSLAQSDSWLIPSFSQHEAHVCVGGLVVQPKEILPRWQLSADPKASSRSEMNPRCPGSPAPWPEAQNRSPRSAQNVARWPRPHRSAQPSHPAASLKPSDEPGKPRLSLGL